MNAHGAGSSGGPVKESIIRRVIGFCAVNRYLTLLAVTALCAFAVYTLKEIRLDALPDLQAYLGFGDEPRVRMDRLVQSARARFESGQGRLEDLLRTQAEQANTLRDVAMFRAEARSSRAR